MVSESIKYILIAIGGALASSTLLLMYVVNIVTEANALHGSKREKRMAYGMRIVCLVFAYVLIGAIAWTFKSATEQSTPEALVLIAAGVATLFFGGNRLKRWKESRMSGNR